MKKLLLLVALSLALVAGDCDERVVVECRGARAACWGARANACGDLLQEAQRVCGAIEE